MATIRKRGDKYQVQVRRQECKGISRTFHQLKDAQVWARQAEAQADRDGLGGDLSILKQTTLATLIVRYRDEVVPSKKGARDEAIVLNAFLRHPICQKKLCSINSADFASYRDERLRCVSTATVKRQLNPIRHMFEVAKDEWGLPITENPLDKVKLKAVDNRRERRLKVGELELILEAASSRRNPYIIPIILFALETAMRRGEILALRWEDVDWNRSCVTIREAKNGYSRTISITPKALNILYYLIKGISNRFKAYSKVHLNRSTSGTYKFKPIPLEIVYPKKLDGRELTSSITSSISTNNTDTIRTLDKDKVFPITANAFRLAWERTKHKAGIEDLHFHDLRHEAISRFFELGLTVPEVASISGHRDARMLLRYAHAQTKVVQEKLSQSS